MVLEETGSPKICWFDGPLVWPLRGGLGISVVLVGALLAYPRALSEPQLWRWG
jgi:hypothetical protein